MSRDKRGPLNVLDCCCVVGVMIGCLVAGRLVQTDAVAFAPDKFLLNVPGIERGQHVAVFLLGTVPFPQGMGGAVYLSYPPGGSGIAADSAWHLLGFLSNEKPSAIFKMVKAPQEEGVSSLFGPPAPGPSQAQIGLSVEPMVQLAQQTPVAGTAVSNLDSFTEFTQKMLENFFNYAASFAVTQAQMVSNPTEAYLPAYETFQRRMAYNPTFWKS
uniref:protein Hikeshi isoform X2 n=1 Tax=Myxine glutinosa TaxID=7769 RepID=UPI0035901875